MLDALVYRLRPGAVDVDDRGREQHGIHADRLLELEHVGVLFLILASIVANNGEPLSVPESGLLGDGLPRLDKRALGPPSRAGYIDVTEAGGGIRVTLGPRCRELAATWSIDLPETPTDGDRD